LLVSGALSCKVVSFKIIKKKLSGKYFGKARRKIRCLGKKCECLFDKKGSSIRINI
jgi:hypothetical protein